MLKHIDMGAGATERRKQTGKLIRKGMITLGGYEPGKIYGLLSCPAGKRMKLTNRIFFKDEQEAITAGYRPCGRCLNKKYREWKSLSKENGREKEM